MDFFYIFDYQKAIQMKTKITLFFFGLFSILSFAQDKSYDLLKNKTTTNILYDRVFALSHATEELKTPVTTNHFNQVYYEMQRADFLNRLPSYEKLKKEAILGKINKNVPLSILITDFESIKSSAYNDGTVLKNANNQIEIKQNAVTVFDKHSINLFSPLVAKTSSNTFILKDDFIFNTTSKIISAIYVRVNENWIKVEKNKLFQLPLTSNQKQTIFTKIEFTNSETIIQSFEIQTENLLIANNKTTNNQLASPNVVNTITATIPYQGFGETSPTYGQGEYEIFLDTVDGILDKPIFLLDGFDPGDTRSTSIVYNLLNYGTSGQNLATDLRALGYDVIILNFPTYTRPDNSIVDGGADFIQRNAFVFTELINLINSQKVGTEQNVVVGPSMGGLIARYALRYMETHAMTHDTRLYISFDSPHLGANVPIGFQHLFNYMAYGPLGNAAVQPVVDGMLKSPAARQMLIDQFEGHLQNGSAYEFNTASASLLPTGCPNVRTPFQTELNTMGFPVNVRNVSIANGAGNGTMNYSPDFEVMNHTFNITTTQRAIINLRFTPNTNTTNQVSRFRGQQWLGFWLTFYESLANSKAPTYTAGLDTAPGGRFDMTGFAAGAGTDPLLVEFFNNLLANYFTFIPTWSSMAVSSTNNLYANVNSSSTTPFLASSIPTVNENHVTLTPTNMAFALNEILNPVLSNNQNVALNSIWITNPVQNSIQINSDYTIEKATIIVTDMLGKSIVTLKNQNIIGSLEIPVALQTGVYLINIKSDYGSIVKKIVKN
jgi:pimeloyl-ACP methyl ester carboxylesterase